MTSTRADDARACLATLVRVSDTTPFGAGCSPLTGTLYTNSEVEPYVAINPTNPQNLVAYLKRPLEDG